MGILIDGVENIVGTGEKKKKLFTSIFSLSYNLLESLLTKRLLKDGRYFFPRIDDSHCNTIHSSLTAVRCFDNGYVGKQPVA